MAPRSFWKGYLKLSLVTCPVAMTPATTDSEKVRFHSINRKTGNRIRNHYVDAQTGKPVRDEDQVHGFASGEDQFVVIEDDELDSIALESTHTIDIETFVPRDSIGWIWHDKPYFLMPDDKVGEEAFAVIRDAMRATGMVGIARVVLFRRERAVMLEAAGKGILAWTLRFGDEVRAADDYFEDVEDAKPEARVVKLVKALIDERTKDWDPSMVEDPVQARLLDIIEAKRKKRKPAKTRAPAEEPPPTPDNVVSIMDALRRSVEQEKKSGKAK
ncbi:Ku protein [Aquibium carbonis]|uniref:Non-homologous end joining protein Ku n=1 Tax=Aquibium carbonis TaxID=2495581 RepID=A0A3R9ZTP1_9HYPH|nr:Ku protein [Aquibium carbonis]RST87482.1 Ku protein [Aquibium carbonis]